MTINKINSLAELNNRLENGLDVHLFTRKNGQHDHDWQDCGLRFGPITAEDMVGGKAQIFENIENFEKDLLEVGEEYAKNFDIEKIKKWFATGKVIVLYNDFPFADIVDKEMVYFHDDDVTEYQLGYLD